MSDREMFVDAIINATGLPYIYGSNGPDSYDCSGLIVACMRKRWPDYADITAAGLHAAYKDRAIAPAMIRPGCLLFFANDCHVVACIRIFNDDIIVLQGANGGTPKCKTINDAFLDNAMIYPVLARIGTGQYHGWWKSGFCGAVDPFQEIVV